MLERMTSRQLTEWGQLFQIKAEEAETEEDGSGRVGLFDPEARGLLGMGQASDDDGAKDEAEDDDTDE